MAGFFVWVFAVMFLMVFFYGLLFDSFISAALVVLVCCVVYASAMIAYFR